MKTEFDFYLWNFGFMFSPFHWGLGIAVGWLDGTCSFEMIIGPFTFGVRIYEQ